MSGIAAAAAALALAAAHLVHVGTLHAQVTSVNVSAGMTTPAGVPDGSGALGAAAALRLDGARWFHVGAGLPVQDAGVQWGVLAAGGRFAAYPARLIVGIDLAGSGYAYRAPETRLSGGGVLLQVLPVLGIRHEPAQLELRSGVLHHSSGAVGAFAERTFHLSDLRVGLGSGDFQVGAEGRYLRSADDAFPYAGGSADAKFGQVDVWAYYGQWFTQVEESPPAWGAGGRLNVDRRTSLTASFQQATNDPIYWNAPYRSWSFGLSRIVGRTSRTVAPVAVPQIRSGQVTFRLPLALADRAPLLAGDFNRWEAVPMSRDGEFWSLTLALTPGIYRYAFRTPEGRWFVPESAPGRTEDDLGVSATLIVP